MFALACVHSVRWHILLWGNIKLGVEIVYEACYNLFIEWIHMYTHHRTVHVIETS